MSAAIEHLKSRDPALAAHIARIGPLALSARRRVDPFVALIEAIVYQQLAGSAASAIWARVEALFEPHAPDAARVHRISDERLRSAGLSRSKAAAIKDCARKTLEGLVPDARRIARMSEAAIHERLTQIRGVGPWTVDMVLLSSLRRPDIMPCSDYGVRKGLQILLQAESLPTPREVESYAQRWRPHRSTAARYLWRILDHSRKREEGVIS